MYLLVFSISTIRAETPEWRLITIFQPYDEALAEVFAEADTTWTEHWTPTDDERHLIAEALGEAVLDPSFEFHRGRSENRDLGWALVLDEVGLHEPITHLILVGPDQRVSEVRVLVFRETRGDEIKRPRFLRQFRGKSLDGRLHVGRDIDGVTGATLSSRAIVRGVRKALTLVELHYSER